MQAFKHTHARKFTDAEILQIREMWRLKVWEGYKVTIPRIAEWFYTTNQTARSIVLNEAYRKVSK